MNKLIEPNQAQNFMGKTDTDHFRYEYLTQAVSERVNERLDKYLTIRFDDFQKALNKALEQGNKLMKSRTKALEDRIARLEADAQRLPGE